MILNSAINLIGFQFTSPGPIILQIGFLTIRWYGLLIACSVLIGVTLSRYLAEKRDIEPDMIGDLVLWLVVAAIPGARIYYVIFQWQEYAQRPQDIMAIWKGGIAIHGAIIGGLIAGFIFSKINKLSFWQLTDIVTPSLILGQAIGRWGNFFNSEAFGSPTNLPWKLYISPDRRPEIWQNYEYFHPTFLYESIWNILVFGFLLTLFFKDLDKKPNLKPGTLFFLYLILYSLGRVWIEGLRTDSLMLGPLRIAQVISLIGITTGTFGLFWLYNLKKNKDKTNIT
ncbi:MAG TPA: prolipoprotein diacylglyceryl transferase [Allocoleopsis sp.]